MNPIVNQSDFQIAAAATAAAALAASDMHAIRKMDSADSENSDAGQWQEDGDYAEDERQRSTRLMQANASNKVPQHGWVDITQPFFEACGELNLGELAQDMLFGLFEAMSAIEMMDPKMDVGMAYNKQDAPPHTFESAVEAGVLKLENLTPVELIGIFDALFTCVVSWLEGNSMDQVLFTCLYLHSPASIKDKALRSFCNAVRNMIVIVKNIIITANVNEEEDFQLYGNSSLMAIEVTSPNIVAVLLKEAEDDWVRQSKSTDTYATEDSMAVVHRLRFMRHFYQALYQFDVFTVNEPEDSLVNEIYKNLNASAELVPQIKRTIDRGTQPTAGSDSPNPMGFSPRIHDRSQPPTFPRTIKIRDRPAAMQFLDELVQRLKYACKILKIRDYYSVLNFFTDFSRRSGQCILSRSVLQALFMSNQLIFGVMPIKDFLWESVRAFNSPPVLNPKHALAFDANVQVLVDSFFRYSVSVGVFTQLIRICGFNRARQRDKLARFIETFDRIQVEAVRLDSSFSLMAQEKANAGQDALATALKHSAQFATWVLYNCFRAMYTYIMSGFELELYAVHEYLYIYWYPYDLLIGFMVSALTRTENNLLAQEEYAEHQSKLQCSTSAKNRKPKPKKNKKQQKPFRQEIVYYHALRSLCGGMYKALGALTKDGRIRQPMPKFDNEEIRFNRRFMPFTQLTSPPPVGYAEFRNLRDHMMSPPSAEIYTAAADLFEQARRVLESIQNPEQEILDLLQVAKTNYVVVKVLAKGHQKDSKTQPEFDFSKHRYFPIIKLT